MVRKLIACLLLGPIVLVVAAGCADRKGSAVIPKEEIPLPKEGPVAGGTGAKQAQPSPAPKGSSSAQ
jgi:hypothetical protein